MEKHPQVRINKQNGKPNVRRVNSAPYDQERDKGMPQKSRVSRWNEHSEAVSKQKLWISWSRSYGSVSRSLKIEGIEETEFRAVGT